MKREVIVQVLGAFYGVVLFCLAALGVILLEETIVNRLMLLGVITLVSLASGLVLGRYVGKITTIVNYYINAAIVAVSAFILIFSGIMAVNGVGIDTSERDRTEVLVVRKMTATKYHMNRNGRRGYTRGAPYKVYRLEMEIPETGVRKFDISKKMYDTVAKGDTVSLAITRGRLGMKVLDPSSIHALHPRIEKSRTRCKFFGTSGRKSQEDE